MDDPNTKFMNDGMGKSFTVYQCNSSIKSGLW